MNLLILSEKEGLKEGFEDYFENVTEKKLSRTRINLLENEEEVLANGNNAKDYDAMLLIPEPELSVYVRALLEKLEKRLELNLNSISSYILSKKQYLYKVLNEKDVPIPKTVVIGSKKSVSGVKSLEYPLVGRMYEGFEKREMELLEDKDGLESFAEPMESGEEIIILQEKVDGDVFDCLVIGDEVISLKLTDNGDWKLRAGKCNEKYHKAPSEVKKIALEGRKSVGANVCRIKVVGDKIVNMSPKPHLDRFKDESGKNTYKKVSDLLKGGK